jgi:hypothetical protein
VLMDTCAHSVDLFRYLVGEVADVRATCHDQFPARPGSVR